LLHAQCRNETPTINQDTKKKKKRERERAFQVVLVVKNPLANAGCIKDSGSIPESGRSPEGGNGNPPQHFLKI